MKVRGLNWHGQNLKDWIELWPNLKGVICNLAFIFFFWNPNQQRGLPIKKRTKLSFSNLFSCVFSPPKQSAKKTYSRFISTIVFPNFLSKPTKLPYPFPHDKLTKPSGSLPNLPLKGCHNHNPTSYKGKLWKKKIIVSPKYQNPSVLIGHCVDLRFGQIVDLGVLVLMGYKLI